MIDLRITLSGSKTLNTIKIYSVALVIIFILSVSLGCSHSNQNQENSFVIPDNYTTYTDKINSFSISYPDNWVTPKNMEQLVSSAKDKVDSKLGSQGETPEFLLAKTYAYVSKSVSVNIITQAATADVNNVGQATDTLFREMKQIDPNFKEVSRKITWVRGEVGAIIEYQARATSDGSLFHGLLLCTVVDNKIWQVTCLTTDEIYEQWSGDFNNILQSFQINY
jgi:hypothetical protein